MPPDRLHTTRTTQVFKRLVLLPGSGEVSEHPDAIGLLSLAIRRQRHGTHPVSSLECQYPDLRTLQIGSEFAIEVGPSGNLARVRATTDGGTRHYLELRNGSTATVDDSGLDLNPGDVVLIIDDEGTLRLDPVPSEVWPDEPWVGVVRIRLADTTVIDSGGRLKSVPTTDRVDYRVGNTVEAGDFAGVTRVLAEEPVRVIDLPAVDDSVISKFRSHPSSGEDLTFEDFGGLKSVVARARELIEVPLLHHAALSAIGARPIKGVLFTGPPGTGKTMLARIIAAQSDSEFYEISGPEVFSKWYGQSEELLRKLFESAAGHERSIIFFDEIDSIAAKRDDDAHEASRRVVAQLLALMDGFTSDTNVVVIATTNRPQDLDLALRRPGRFDWEIEFPLPTRDDREDILSKSASQLRTGESLPHKVIAGKTDGWSAADITAIWSEAALLAVEDNRDRILTEDYVGGFERVAKQRLRVGDTGWSVTRK